MDIHALRQRGWSISAIARHVDRNRKTVRAYLDGKRQQRDVLDLTFHQLDVGDNPGCVRSRQVEHFVGHVQVVGEPGRADRRADKATPTLFGPTPSSAQITGPARVCGDR